ncbi:MAG: Ppx/GppA family phosphatase [Gammaproteobacteria bacterium]|nr:Ppx/GppA family phosphatase [Gammaproteobacteria bacterium]
MIELSPATVAAVDLGSNSFHMKVADVQSDQFLVIDRMREMVQLAAGLDEHGNISDEARDRALRCLEKFGQRLRGMPSEAVRAVGTNTLRRARGAAAFLEDAQTALGHPIDIIAGREEARLIYLGVSHSVTQDEEQLLVIDIGGGSTEFIIGRRFTPLMTESLYMGCVGMSQAHFSGGIVDRKRMKAAELEALQQLEPIQAAYSRTGWDAAIGASGTLLALEQILRERGWQEHGIDLAGLRKLRDELIDAGKMSKFSSKSLREARVPTLPGGLAIALAMFQALDIDRLETSGGALREGLLYDLLGRHGQGDVRGATIADLSRRYGVDAAQANRVERTALFLRAQVAPAWRLRKEKYGNILSWAAQLHELGLMIAHSQYHKHGAYVLENADMPGFSLQEQGLLATLVRAHRRKFPLTLVGSLPGVASERAERLCVLLRLAVVMHRSRVEIHLPAFEAKADGKNLTLKFPSGWLAEHPLTAADLAEEAQSLSASGVRLSVR